MARTMSPKGADSWAKLPCRQQRQRPTIRLGLGLGDRLEAFRGGSGSLRGGMLEAARPALALERAVDAGWTPQAAGRETAQHELFQPSQAAITASRGRSVDVDPETVAHSAYRKDAIGRDFPKPSIGLEPMTPSLPWLRL